MDEMRVLTSSPLFAGINGAEAAAMLRCLSPYQRSFHAGGTILRAGEAAVGMGLVLEGSVRLEHVDAWGGRRILERFEPGATFAEAYACAAGEPLLVDVVAETDCTVLFLDAARMLRPCPSACAYHARLVRNLLAEMAKKNLLLSRKIRLITPRTIRGRLLAYLSGEVVRHGARTFDIPFDRQQLADYLAVERSALSAELSQMRREGLIECHKSRFTLLTNVDGER